MIKKIIASILIFASPMVFPNENIIALTGEGKIEVVPDIINMSIEIGKMEKSDVSKAKAYVDQLSSKAASVLIKQGISEKDITSSSLNVHTVTKYDEHENENPVGYAVTRDIQIVIRDISTYNKIIQALVDVGVTDITSVKPDVSDREEVQRKALAQAAQKATEKAKFLASQFGAKLGKVYKIGDQRVRHNFGVLEEVLVTAQRRMASNIKSVQYEFHPAPVEVQSSIYVEFELK